MFVTQPEQRRCFNVNNVIVTSERYNDVVSTLKRRLKDVGYTHKAQY